MDTIDAIKLMLGQQGIPPELVDLGVSKLEDLDALLQSKIEAGRSEIIRNKAQAVAALRGAAGTEKLIAALVAEIEEMVSPGDAPADPEEPLVPN